MMKISKKLLVGMITCTFLFSVLSTAGMAYAENENINDAAKLETGSTEAFGGGDYIAVSMRDAKFTVIYGNETNENNIIIVSEYTRYLGGAEIYDNQDNFIEKRGIPIRTIFAQKFMFMYEFNDANDNGLFDMHRYGLINMMEPDSIDIPYKWLSLNQSWTMSDLTNETSQDKKTMWVDFTLGISNRSYDLILDDYVLRKGTQDDGVVERIELRFHITINLEEIEIKDVPWYHVNVDNGNERVVTHSEFMGTRNYTGLSLNATFKYDHYIEGWDFRTNSSKLALETRVVVGNAVCWEVLHWAHKQFGKFGNTEYQRIIRWMHTKHSHEVARYMKNNHMIECNDTANVSTLPVRITRDRIVFDDNWERIGRLTWISNVTVDGEEKNMTFQIHGGGPAWMKRGRHIFVGFHIIGAFIYPSGNVILHDPTLDSTILFFKIAQLRYLLPMPLLLAQLLIVGVGLVTAAGFAVMKKRKKE